MMLGINVEQGRIRDTPELRIKTVLRLLVDRYDMPMTLTPSQSIVLRDIKPKDKYDVSGARVELGGGGGVGPPRGLQRPRWEVRVSARTFWGWG